jgi:hypothetical protein
MPEHLQKASEKSKHIKNDKETKSQIDSNVRRSGRHARAGGTYEKQT